MPQGLPSDLQPLIQAFYLFFGERWFDRRRSTLQCVGKPNELVAALDLAHFPLAAFLLRSQSPSQNRAQRTSHQRQRQIAAEQTFQSFAEAIPFPLIPLAQSGCGYSTTHFPGMTPIAGWDAASVSIGYRDSLKGRFWVTDFDWQDNEPYDKTNTNKLMGYMITHRK